MALIMLLLKVFEPLTTIVHTEEFTIIFLYEFKLRYKSTQTANIDTVFGGNSVNCSTFPSQVWFWKLTRGKLKPILNEEAWVKEGILTLEAI